MNRIFNGEMYDIDKLRKLCAEQAERIAELEQRVAELEEALQFEARSAMHAAKRMREVRNRPTLAERVRQVEEVDG